MKKFIFETVDVVHFNKSYTIEAKNKEQAMLKYLNNDYNFDEVENNGNDCVDVMLMNVIEED